MDSWGDLQYSIVYIQEIQRETEILHQHVAKCVGRQGLQSKLAFARSSLNIPYGRAILSCGLYNVVQKGRTS